MEAIFLTFFQQVNKRVGEMHHPRQADRFRGLGMFTQRCRLLRPQPETERRDRRLFGAHRILAGEPRRDEQPTDSTAEAFCSNSELFTSNGGQKPAQDPFVRLETINGGLISPVIIHVQFTVSPTQDKSPVNQKNLSMEDLAPKISSKQQHLLSKGKRSSFFRCRMKKTWRDYSGSSAAQTERHRAPRPRCSKTALKLAHRQKQHLQMAADRHFLL